MPDAHDPAAGALKDQPSASQPHDAPMVFLVGPPDSGKSALGRRVCAELGLPFVDRAELKALVEDMRSSEELSPAEREGLLGWCGNWRDDFNADARACDILVDALARFRSTWEAFGTFLRDSAMSHDSSREP